MSLKKIEVIDGYHGSVIGGEPSPGDIIRITEGNTVQEHAYRVKISTKVLPTPVLFLDLEIVDSNGGDTPSIKNDGIDTAAFTLTLRRYDESLLSVNKKFNVILRDTNNSEHSILRVVLVSGVAAFDYKTVGRSATVHIHEEDIIAPGGNFDIKVRGENSLMIFEDFTS